MKANRQPSAKRPVSDAVTKTHEKLKALAWLLDSSIRLPGGFRIGVDALFGLLPFFGDAAGVVLSGYIVSQAARLGLPSSVLGRMLFNIAVEGVIGIIPIFGDIFDAAWKANQRNIRLLEQHIAAPAQSAAASRRWLFIVVVLFVVFAVVLGSLSALLVRLIWDAFRN